MIRMSEIINIIEPTKNARCSNMKIICPGKILMAVCPLVLLLIRT